jgi:hypothetical protein
MEDTTQPSGQPDNASSMDQNNNPENTNASGIKNTVAYESHKKLLAEKKNLQSRFEDLEKKFNNINEEKLSSEGKKDELLEAYKKQIADKDDLINNFAYTSVSKDVKLKAQAMGCVDTDALIKLIDLTAFNNISNDLSIDSDEANVMLEDSKKRYPYLFKKEAPVIHDGVVKKSEGNTTYADDLAACTTQKELEAVRRKHGRI